jgi:hypothetical protein
MDRRLQKRYCRLVNEHSHVASHLAGGISAFPGLSKPFAATQALWRFLKNPSVTLSALIEPMQELARESLIGNRAPYALVVHDWSMLNFSSHLSKRDRVQRTHADDVGYELSAALVVEASEGMPVALMDLTLRTADGVHSTRRAIKDWPRAHVDQVGPAMAASAEWGLDRPLVHIVDREADSLDHYRQWTRAGHRFLVRADSDRRVLWQGSSILLRELSAQLPPTAFAAGETVKIRGKTGRLQVAETLVVLDRPAKKRRDG